MLLSDISIPILVFTHMVSHISISIQSSLDHLPPFILTLSFQYNDFSRFTKIQNSLSFKFNPFYAAPLLSADSFASPKGGG